MLAQLTATVEAVLLEQFDRRAKQKPAVGLPAGRDFGDGLNTPTAQLGDLLQGTHQRSARNPLPTMARVDVKALNSPVQSWWRFSLICTPMLYPHKLLRVTELAPPL